MSEWQEALAQLQTDLSTRPLKQDMDALSLLMDKQLKLLNRRLSRLSKRLEQAAGTEEGSEEAAVMKRQMIADFRCLSCDKKLLFTRKECVVIHPQISQQSCKCNIDFISQQVQEIRQRQTGHVNVNVV